MQNVIGTLAALDLAALVKTNKLDGGALKLFMNNLTVVIGTVIGDFVEANFHGYLAVVTTLWNTPRVALDGSAESISPLAVFNFTAGTPTCDVYGYWLEDSKGNLVLAGNFEGAPIAMASVGDQIALLLTFTEPNTAGASILIP